MKITDLFENNNLLCDPNKDLAKYTRKVEANVKGELIDVMLKNIINYNYIKMSGNYKTFYGNGKTKEVGKLYENKWDGLFSNYYENGNLREKNNYIKGILDGDYNYYNCNSEGKENKLCVDGKLEGTREVYFETKKLKSRTL